MRAAFVKKHARKSVAILLLLVAGAILLSIGDNDEAPVAYGYKIVNSFDHDSQAFTQGLVFEDGFLYEGTGLYGYSSLRKVELKTGKVVQFHRLGEDLFGEGITIFKDKIIQLTLYAQTGFVYHKSTFEIARQFDYPFEGWGITHDGEHLITSDGTAELRFLDPDTFQEVRRIKVMDDGTAIQGLNELEYVEGEIFANIWFADRIVRIEPQTGEVTSWIDLTGLRAASANYHPDAVLNGIAYDPAGKRLFVTGKLWSKLYQIKLVPVR